MTGTAVTGTAVPGSAGPFLVLGCTRDAGDLATRLQLAGIPVICALLGPATRQAPVPPVEVLSGGFGGVEGFVRFLAERRVRGVVDARHPFAVGISPDALVATQAAGVSLVRLLPPAWEAQGPPPHWRWADDHVHARQITEGLGVDRPFLSVGGRSLASYTRWADRYVLARVAELPTWRVPERWEVIRSPETHAYSSEYALLANRRIGVMVTRDTGGPLSTPKLRAAADLGVFVVMVRRPASPAGLRAVQSVDDAYAWVARHWRPQDFASPSPGRQSH